MVKHRQLAPTVGPPANDGQKKPMAPLNDNPVLENGTSFRVGSWILIADGLGTKIFQKFQKLQNATNSTNSSINSKKSDSRTSATKPEFNPNSAQSEPKHSPSWKRTWKD